MTQNPDPIKAESPEVKRLLEAALDNFSAATELAKTKGEGFTFELVNGVSTGHVDPYGYNGYTTDPEDAAEDLLEQEGYTYSVDGNDNEAYWKRHAEIYPALEAKYYAEASVKTNVSVTLSPDGHLEYTSYWLPSGAFC